MKIILFTTETNPTQGIGRYTIEMKEALKKEGIDVSIIEKPRLLPLPGKRHINNMFIFPLKILLKQYDYRNSIFHFAAPEFSSLIFSIKRKKVVTFHDLITLISPETGKLLAKQYYLTFSLATKFSDYIITNSNQTKDEVIRFFPWARNKIKVVNLGVNKKFKAFSFRKKEKLKKFYYGSRKLVIGYLGAFGKRKRVGKLILDFRQNWKKEGTILVIWGADKRVEYLHRLAKNDKRIKFMGFAPEKEIVKIYNSFDIFVFPTGYEGFGLPILEAVACGVPCFVYKDARISGEVRKYTFQMVSIKEIPEIIKNVNIKEIRKKYEKVKKEFNWEKTAKETIKVYEEISNKN